MDVKILIINNVTKKVVCRYFMDNLLYLNVIQKQSTKTFFKQLWNKAKVSGLIKNLSMSKCRILIVDSHGFLLLMN